MLGQDIGDRCACSYCAAAVGGSAPPTATARTAADDRVERQRQGYFTTYFEAERQQQRCRSQARATAPRTQRQSDSDRPWHRMQRDREMNVWCCKTCDTWRSVDYIAKYGMPPPSTEDLPTWTLGPRRARSHGYMASPCHGYMAESGACIPPC